jgi:hypothetical protein
MTSSLTASFPLPERFRAILHSPGDHGAIDARTREAGQTPTPAAVVLRRAKSNLPAPVGSG